MNYIVYQRVIKSHGKITVGKGTGNVRLGEGGLATLNRSDQVSLGRSRLSQDMEDIYACKYSQENIPSRGTAQYHSPEVGVPGTCEKSAEASVAAMETERTVKAEVREAREWGGCEGTDHAGTCRSLEE